MTSGPVQPAARGPGAAVNVALEQRILRHFRERPMTSTRKAGRVFEVNNRTVIKCYKIGKNVLTNCLKCKFNGLEVTR